MECHGKEAPRRNVHGRSNRKGNAGRTWKSPDIRRPDAEQTEEGRKNMQKTVGILFFVSWLLCGCGVETMLDHPAVGAVTLIALIVVIACAMVLSSYDN